MGSMHTGLEDRAWDLPKLAAYFAERARGGVGLIVTGGYAPTKRGWLQAVRLRDDLAAAGDAAPRGHRTRCTTRAARSRCRCCTPAATATTRSASAPRPGSRRSRRSSRQRAVHARACDRHRHRLRATSVALARKAGYDARRDHGLRGLPDQPVPRRRAPTTATTTGAARPRTGCASPSRSCAGPASGRRRLPDRLPDLAARPGRGRPDLGRDRRARPPARGGRGHRPQHRHRLARGPGARRSSPRSRAAPGASATARLQGRGRRVPVCASNRINTPEVAEEILASGEADLVSMARPLLADPEFVAKAAAGRADEINTCIACNQACLDHVFANQRASCLVNPRACRETTLVLGPDPARRGRSRSSAPARPGWPPRCPPPSAASRSPVRDGPPSSAASSGSRWQVPGKEEFAETLRYYAPAARGARGRRTPLRTAATAADLARYDEVVVATGVVPRMPDARRASTTRSVASYADVLSGAVVPGTRVAVHRRGRHRRRRQRTSSPTTRPRTSTTGWRTGASATRRCTRAG